MRTPLKLIIALLLVGCNRHNDHVLMTRFEILDKRDFKMCFNKELKCYYEITFVTKSGKTKTKGGPLVRSHASEAGYCYTGQKMQYSFRAYSEIETKFYQDSVVNSSLDRIEWKLYESDFKDPFANGTWMMDSALQAL